MIKHSLKLLLLIPLFALLLAFSFTRRAGRPLVETGSPETARSLEGEVMPGQVLSVILEEAGLAPAQANGITAAFSEVFDLRRLRPGDSWAVCFDEAGAFDTFRYQNSPLAFFEVRHDLENGGYSADTVRLEAQLVTRGAAGRISSSLYQDMTALGVPAELVVQFAEIFASRIDFFSDPRPGDPFLAAWEAYSVNGGVVKNGRIVAAAYGGPDNGHRAYFFENEAGESGYFDGQGASLESAFLRAPLNYRRISSHFTHRRFHPIHRVYRPHLGIDYAAPAGTPVSAIGAGRVLEAGWRNCGFGNTIRIQHPNGYISYYGHLSRFARGIRPGRRVSRGEVIGYVGATGTATGPHLDFRIRKDGRFVNFLALDLPPAFTLSEDDRPLFENVRDERSSLLEGISCAACPEEGVLEAGVVPPGGETAVAGSGTPRFNFAFPFRRD